MPGMQVYGFLKYGSVPLYEKSADDKINTKMKHKKFEEDV